MVEEHEDLMELENEHQVIYNQIDKFIEVKHNMDDECKINNDKIQYVQI